MTIFCIEQRPSDSPFVELVWRAHCERPGAFTSMTLRVGAKRHRRELLGAGRDAAQRHGEHDMRGPETKATPLLCAVQAEWAGISFTPGSFLPHVLASDLVDGAVDLPTAIGGGIHASAHHGDYARR